MFETYDHAGMAEPGQYDGVGLRTPGPGDGNPISKQRRFVDIAVELTTYDGKTYDVRVGELSPGGAFLIGFGGDSSTVPIEFNIRMYDEDSALSLDGVCRLVHVQWMTDGRLSLGCRFIQIDSGRLEAVLRSC